MKRHLATLLALGALGAAQPSLAQQVPAPTVAEGHSILTVTGQGDADSAPDLAVFSAGVQSQASNAAEALADNSRNMAKVIAALKRSGIAEKDIQTSNLSINPVYSDPEQEAMRAARANGQPYVPLPPEQNVRRIVGYEVTNNVMVRQRDLKNFGKVIDTLVSAGATQVNGPNFQLENEKEAMDRARVASIKDARARAELYARASGLRIVRVLTIAEGGGYYRPQPMFRSVSMDVAAPPAPPPAPIQPGQLSLNSSVTVTYELAP
ncbi:MAG: SIMPL domain-containing protein [Novosphingobium sp.]|nr:SIMPL domain-containing protein [Novosphingobium sp.]